MSSDESITLAPLRYARVCIYHCDVTREGFVAAAGETQVMAMLGLFYSFLVELLLNAVIVSIPLAVTKFACESELR